MKDALERLEDARQACAEALERISVRVPVPGGDGATVWDAAGAERGLERVNEAFGALGDLEALPAEVGPERRAALDEALRALARVHSLLTVSVAREKDALRDRLLLAQSASRGFEWHGAVVAGHRCDLRG